MIKFNIPIKIDTNGLDSMSHFSSNGIYTKKCSDFLKKLLSSKDLLLTNSCTSSLQIAALLLNLKKGDEIILPSYTFVSSANSFFTFGAKPVFVDIDPYTLNIDVKKIEDNISQNTKAIVIVHYAGVPCDMRAILQLKKKYNIYLIEDCAHALGVKYKNKYLGEYGDLSCFSFHDTKNIHCGEGGALAVNNKNFLKRARFLKDKGTNRFYFDKNIIKKYNWVDKGGSYGLSEINAFILYKNLKKLKSINYKRKIIWKRYLKLFEKSFIKKYFLDTYILNFRDHNGHIFFLILKKPSIRKNLINYLKKKKIPITFHYIPLHKSTIYRKTFKQNYKLINTEFIAKSLIRLPMHLYIKFHEQKKIINEIEKFFFKK